MRTRSLFFPGLATLSLAALLCSGVASGAQPPAAIRAVQVGAIELQLPDAAARIEALTARARQVGLGEVWVRELDGKSLVLVGKLESLPDTTLLKLELKKRGFPDAFQKAFKNESQEEFESVPYTATPFVFVRADIDAQTGEAEFVPEPLLVEVLGRARTDRKPEDLAILRSRLALAPQGSLLKGWLLHEVSCLSVLESGLAKPSMPDFMSIATGEVKAPPETVVQAQFAVADLTHEYYPNFLRAYRYYRELAQLYKDDPALHARARVMIVATMLSMAQSQAAYYNEVVREAQKLREAVPLEYAQARTVSWIMEAEAHLFDGNAAMCLVVLDRMQSTEPSIPDRQRALMHALYALTYQELGNLEAAKEACLSALSVRVSKSEELNWAGLPFSLTNGLVRQARYLADQTSDSPLRAIADRLSEELETETSDKLTYDESIFARNRIFATAVPMPAEKGSKP